MYATPGTQRPRASAKQSNPLAVMKIVASNFADTLRRPGTPETPAIAVLDTVREELRGFYGEADHDLPTELTVLAQRIDCSETSRGVSS